jgi:hypothetical protein
MAAIVGKNIAAMTGSSNADATSYNLGGAGASPEANSVYYVYSLALRSGGQTAVPTLSGTNGWNVEWTPIANVSVGNIRLTVFRGVTGATTTAGVLTVNYGSETQTAHAGHTIKWRSAESAPVQHKTGTAEAATSIAVTLDNAFADPWNGTVMAVGAEIGTGTFNTQQDVEHYPPASQGGLTATDGIQLTLRFSPINLASMTIVRSNSANLAAIMMEIDHDGSDVGGAGGDLDDALGEGVIIT